MEMWDTHGEKWDVMSQFSPYIPLRIVPVLPMATRFIPHSHIHEEGRKDTPNTVNVRYCIYSTCFTHLQKEKKTNCYTENLCFVTVLTNCNLILEWNVVMATKGHRKTFPRSWLAENSGRYQRCPSSPLSQLSPSSSSGRTKKIM